MSVSRQPPKVLVLGKEERAFLAVVRSLGRQGIEVHVAWLPQDALTRHSRYVKKIHELPRYAPGDDAWKHAFIQVCRDERFDLVVPCNDATIMPLQTHRAELEPHARIYLLDDLAYGIAFDKDRTNETAAALGINLPRGERVSLPLDPDAIAARFRFPIVLKPITSFTLDDLASKHFVQRVPSPADLPKALQTFARDREVLVQEYFEGTGVGVEGLVHQGTVLAALQHVRVHERRKGGADSYRRTVPLHPGMHDAFTKLVRAMHYTGVVMLEFKMNFRTGDWVLLEINGRFWASLPVAVAAGADFPYWLYQMLVEGKRDFPQTYRPDVYCRNWGRDITWIRENFAAPPAERVPTGTLLQELGPLLRGREHSDTFVLDDPKPGLEDAKRILRWFSGKAARILRRQVAALPPVRALAATRAGRALGAARSVLFVCKGNICRSPFAEAYARRLLGDAVTVRSAGYHPKSDRPCPPAAVTAARELGIDLAAHRSTLLTQALIDAADAVVVFDEENVRIVSARFPAARPKLHRLGYLAGNGTVDIRDPYGGPVETFRATYRTIQRSLDAAGGR